MGRHAVSYHVAYAEVIILAQNAENTQTLLHRATLPETTHA